MNSNPPVPPAAVPPPPPDCPSTSSSAALPIDNRVTFMNLSTVSMRMDSIQQFLSQTLTTNTILSRDQMDLISSEIVSAIHQTIVNGAALLSSSYSASPLQPFTTPATAASFLNQSDHPPGTSSAATVAVASNQGANLVKDDDEKDEGFVDLDASSSDCEIVELDAVELLAEHIHFCEICGKGFKRDANLRMHMRAHGNQFKTPEALSKPDNTADRLGIAGGSSSGKTARFSCPFQGCNRNKGHKKFRPLKSVICVKNHFKRSHCPKMYACDRCNKKSFSVLADLKSHLKHCGENKWRCSCGTSFSRKDKLFGHMALFEGHMPAVTGDVGNGGSNEGIGNMVEDDEDEDALTKDEDVLVKDEEFEYGDGVVGGNSACDNGFFEGLLDGFGSIDGYSLQDVLNGMQGFNGVL